MLVASSSESECGLSRRPNGDSEWRRLVERVHRFLGSSSAPVVDARGYASPLDGSRVLCEHCETDAMSASMRRLVTGGV